MARIADCPYMTSAAYRGRGREASNEPCHEKTTFCICENKDTDELHGNREADHRLCFRYTDSTIPLLPKCKISSL